jgi:integrase
VFPFFSARRPLVSITTHDVQQFVTWLMDEKKQGQRLTPRTARRILAPLSACSATAKRQGLVRFNPVDGVGVPRRSDEEDTGEERVKVLTRAQLAEFLLAVPADWRLFFEVLAVTGARWSEAIAWQWKHFDAGGPSLRVERSLYNGKPQRPKSKFGRRTIPVSDRIAVALSERRQALAAADALIFPASNGAPLRQENVRRRVLKPAATAAGVQWMGFHTLRHTAASLLFRAGRRPPEREPGAGAALPWAPLALVHARDLRAPAR